MGIGDRGWSHKRFSMHNSVHLLLGGPLGNVGEVCCIASRDTHTIYYQLNDWTVVENLLLALIRKRLFVYCVFATISFQLLSIMNSE
jgi:hypothetical protein